MGIRFVMQCLMALMLAGSEDQADVPRPPIEPEAWHEGWISIRQAPRGSAPGVAVLHNRGRRKISTSNTEDRAHPALFRRSGDGWKFAGSRGFCGTGSTVRTLAPGDSLRFEFSPEDFAAYAVPGESHEYRVSLWVREVERKGWGWAVSGTSFRYP